MALVLQTPAALRQAWVMGQIAFIFWDPTGKFIAVVQPDDHTTQVWSVTP